MAVPSFQGLHFSRALRIFTSKARFDQASAKRTSEELLNAITRDGTLDNLPPFRVVPEERQDASAADRGHRKAEVRRQPGHGDPYGRGPRANLFLPNSFSAIGLLRRA